MRALALSIATAGLLALSGCASMLDSDGDGVSNADETAAGTDPDNVDTDGDGLRDGGENVNGTDPLVADTDGDGLLDGEEVKDYGLDPLDPDMDMDGVLDGDEVANGSDPQDQWSWPWDAGIWPDFSWKAEGVTPGVWDMDQVLPNTTFLDQYGNTVSLHQFYGMVVLVDFSAGWCGPCQGVAAEAQAMFEAHRSDGFIILHAMVDDYSYTGEIEDEDFTMDWATEYGLTFPVAAQNDGGDASGELYNAGVYQGYIPFMLLVDRDMQIDATYEGGGQEEAIEARIEVLTAE